MLQKIYFTSLTESLGFYPITSNAAFLHTGNVDRVDLEKFQIDPEAFRIGELLTRSIAWLNCVLNSAVGMCLCVLAGEGGGGGGRGLG